jgi:hypothetical protein
MDMPTTDFVRAGSLEELKAKGRLVVHGPHRPILVVHDRGRVFALWQHQLDVMPGSVSSSCENRTCRISFVVTLPLPFFSTKTSCCASGRPAGMTIFPPAFN